MRGFGEPLRAAPSGEFLPEQIVIRGRIDQIKEAAGWQHLRPNLAALTPRMVHCGQKRGRSARGGHS